MTIHTQPLQSVSAIGDAAPRFIADHMVRTFRDMVRGPGVISNDRLISYITGEPHPFGNAAFLTRADDVNIATEATSALAPCTAPAAIVLPDAPTPTVAQHIESRGYAFAELMPRMAMDLERLAPAQPAGGDQFIQIRSAAQSSDWVDAFAVGYELPRPIGALFAPDATGSRPGLGDSLQFYAIIRDGAMVSTSMLYLADGVAGIYCIATRPTHRGKGLGATVTSLTLHAARKQGFNVGILQASPAGHPIYRKLGFAEFGAMRLYVRMPS